MMELFLGFLASSLMAQTPSFNFSHPQCQFNLILEAQDFSERDTLQMEEKLVEAAAKKRLEPILPGQRPVPSALTLQVKMHRSGFLFKTCHVDLKLLGRRADNTTMTLGEAVINRQFPRVSFRGNERCTRAIDDAFVQVPTCLKSGR